MNNTFIFSLFICFLSLGYHVQAADIQGHGKPSMIKLDMHVLKSKSVNLKMGVLLERLLKFTPFQTELQSVTVKNVQES